MILPGKQFTHNISIRTLVPSYACLSHKRSARVFSRHSSKILSHHLSTASTTNTSSDLSKITSPQRFTQVGYTQAQFPSEGHSKKNPSLWHMRFTTSSTGTFNDKPPSASNVTGTDSHPRFRYKIHSILLFQWLPFQTYHMRFTPMTKSQISTTSWVRPSRPNHEKSHQLACRRTSKVLFQD